MIAVILPRFEYDLIDKRRFKDILLIRSGIGKIEMTHAVMNLFWTNTMVHRFLLFGFCAAYGNEDEIGTVIEPSGFLEADFDLGRLKDTSHLIEFNGKHLFKDSVKCMMFSQDKFMNEPITSYGEMTAYDMESYAFAWFCKEYQFGYNVVR